MADLWGELSGSASKKRASRRLDELGQGVEGLLHQYTGETKDILRQYIEAAMGRMGGVEEAYKDAEGKAVGALQGVDLSQQAPSRALYEQQQADLSRQLSRQGAKGGMLGSGAYTGQMSEAQRRLGAEYEQRELERDWRTRQANLQRAEMLSNIYGHTGQGIAGARAGAAEMQFNEGKLLAEQQAALGQGLASTRSGIGQQSIATRAQPSPLYDIAGQVLGEWAGGGFKMPGGGAAGGASSGMPSRI